MFPRKKEARGTPRAWKRCATIVCRRDIVILPFLYTFITVSYRVGHFMRSGEKRFDDRGDRIFAIGVAEPLRCSLTTETTHEVSCLVVKSLN